MASEPGIEIHEYQRGSAVGFELLIPSAVDAVPDAVAIVSERCLGYGMPERHVRFNLHVALTEALTNAILYGNGEGSEKAVSVKAELADGLVRVEVMDEGEGFDPDSVPDPTQPDRIELPFGRGLFLIRHMVDDVSFSERGNSICMVLRPI